MIIKGASRRNVKFWAKHLTDTKKNDRAEMVDKRGLLSDNLTDLLHEIQDNAHLTRCKNAMYIASFSPAIGEKLTEVDWQRAYEIFEKQRGIPEGQRRVVYEHEKEGRTHRHVVWDRIDAEKMKAFPDAHDWKICAIASQEIAQELELQHTRGILFREPGTPRPERNPKAWEMFRGMQTGVDVQELAADVQALRQQSENGQQFKAALEQHGFQLTTGKRGLLILDSAGKEHSLARRCGITQKDINAFMRDVNREALPTLEQAKEQHRERTHTALHTELGSVLYQIECEDKLAATAIEKEKIERRFVEPQPERGTLAARQQQQQQPPPAPQLGRTAGEIRLAYTLTHTGQQFANALEDRGLILSQTTEADAERLNKWEAQRMKEQERELQDFQKYRPGELVVINQHGDIYKLTRSNTGDDAKARAEHLKGIDRAALLSITAAQGAMQQFRQDQREEKEQTTRDTYRPEEPPKELTGTAAKILLAHYRSDSARSFAAALAEKGIAVAITTKEDAERSRSAAAAAFMKGSYAPVYREGEIVAVNDRATVYRLNESTTGSKFADMQRYLRNGLDTSALRSIEAAREMMQDRAAERAGRGSLFGQQGSNREQDILDRAERRMRENERAASTREGVQYRTVLDREARRTMENERAQGPRNTRDS